MQPIRDCDSKMCVRACVRSYMRAYVCVCVRACVRARARVCVRACLRECPRGGSHCKNLRLDKTGYNYLKTDCAFLCVVLIWRWVNVQLVCVCVCVCFGVCARACAQLIISIHQYVHINNYSILAVTSARPAAGRS